MKEIRYEKIPDYFNQETHYIIQSPPVEYDEYIYYNIIILKLPMREEVPEWQ